VRVLSTGALPRVFVLNLHSHQLGVRIALVL
jgi:hypothetical protein